MNDPHDGPLPGDASHRLHFCSAQEYRAAMALAARLEAKGLARRAWRVRWNLDGPQPARAALPPTTMETDDDRGGRASTEVPGLAQMVERTGLSNWQRGGEMNREEIIRLAESAGITVIGEAVWRLCELVAAAEREALAEDRLDEGERCPCTRCDYSCEDRRKGER